MMILAKTSANRVKLAQGLKFWQRWLSLLIRTPQGTG